MGLGFYAQVHKNLNALICNLRCLGLSDIYNILSVLCVKEMNISTIHLVKFLGFSECSDGGRGRVKPK